MDNYKKSLQSDKVIAEEYYKKSLSKTQQQVFLESLLPAADDSHFQIADIGCGGGTLSHHLRPIFKNAGFTLVDFNEDALLLAEKLNGENKFKYINDDIYS